MKTFDVETLILGATFYGCGLAARIRNSLLVETSIIPGSDDVLAFSPGSGWENPFAHPLAEELRRALLACHALNGGKLWTGALAPVFAEWLEKNCVQPLFGLTPVECSGNSIRFSDLCGSEVIVHAKRILDARARVTDEKFLTALIRSPDEIGECACGPLRISYSGLPGWYYIALPLPETAPWQTARRELHRVWRERPDALRGARLLVTASRFSRPRFRNAGAALEAGLCGDAPADFLPPDRPEQADFCDVLVVGFGTAGSAAAVAAAQRGARVKVIERGSCAGGIWTGGFVPKCYLQKTTGMAAAWQKEALEDAECIGTTEPLKRVMEESAEASGAEIHYEACAFAVETENRTVKSVLWTDESGVRRRTTARVVIDATAEGSVCRLAGCEMICGRTSDGECNTYTNSMGVWRSSSFGVANFDAGRMTQRSCTDFSRNYLHTLRLHLREDFRTEPLCIIPSEFPGVREGSRIVPEKRYTIDDFFASHGQAPETLFRVLSNLDTHTNGTALEDGIFQDWLVVASLWETRLSIPVPRSALFPRGFSGIIAAGRHLGVDYALGCAIRMIPTMAALGEISGMIAARSIAAGCAPADLPYDSYAPELPVPQDAPESLNYAWFTMTEEDILRGLASDSPGLAVWNARMRNLSGLLRKFLAESAPDSLLRIHSALALGMLGDESAVPELMRIAARRDSAVPNPGFRHACPRDAAAICLLGKLHVENAVPLMLSLLTEPDCGDIRKAHLTAALIRIGDHLPETRSRIASVLRLCGENAAWRIDEPLNCSGRTVRVDGLFRVHIAGALGRWGVPHRVTEILPDDLHDQWMMNRLNERKTLC